MRIRWCAAAHKTGLPQHEPPVVLIAQPDSFAQSADHPAARSLGHRVSDEFIVPVCRIHHRELHRSGDEAAWWQKLNIDPLPVALRLWQHTHSEFAQTSEGMTPTQPAKALDMSAQPPLDPYANVQSPIPKDGEPNASE
jgi:hypothetical protein